MMRVEDQPDAFSCHPSPVSGFLRAGSLTVEETSA